MKVYKIFIDENMPAQLATGLNILQEPQNAKDGIEVQVLSIKNEYGKGAADEDWIPKVGSQNGIVITQDYKIHTTRHQNDLYKKHGVGILFISPPNKAGFSYWEMVEEVVYRWNDIKKIIKKNKTPFAFRCKARSGFKKL